jgi:hypothetical protein
MDAKDRLSSAAYDSIESMMLAYAQEAVRVAWSAHRQRLDLSPSSIGLLEKILDGQAAVDLEFQTRLWGGYFGEVLRANFGGDWEMTEYPGSALAVPTLVVRGSRLYPLMKVYRRLTLGESENLPSFYRMIAERLAEAPAN